MALRLPLHPGMPASAQGLSTAAIGEPSAEWLSVEGGGEDFRPRTRAHLRVATMPLSKGDLVDCDFSEFSYGYACIREAEGVIATAYAQAGAPHLPSLKEENKVGWDAAINTTMDYALFLQFKRPEFVSRQHPQSRTWPHAGSKHYRVSIDTDHAQHAALTNLEHQITTGVKKGDVFYVAPTFLCRATSTRRTQQAIFWIVLRCFCRPSLEPTPGCTTS